MRALSNMKMMTWVGVFAVSGLVGGCGGTNTPYDDALLVAVAGAVEACDALNDAADAAGSEAVCVDSCEDRTDSACVTPADIVAAAAANPHSLHPVELALAFNQIKAGDADDAKETLTPFLGADNEPETYTYVVASIKETVDFLAPLLDLIASQLAPGLPAGGFAAAADIDVKGLVESALQDIVDSLTDAAREAAVIQSSADTWVDVPSVPLDLEADTINEIADDPDLLPSEIKIDLAGIWDRGVLLLIGAAGDGILGIVDYLFAHKLKLDLGKAGDLIDTPTSAEIADFLAGSSDLLAADSNAAENFSSANAHFIGALNFIVGKAGGGQGAEGLLAEMEANLADPTQGIIVIKDVDADGKISEDDTITLTFVEQLIPQFPDDLEAGDEIIEVPAGNGVWSSLTELGRAILNNLDGSVAGAVSIAKLIDADTAGVAGEVLAFDELQQLVLNETADTTSDFDFTNAGALPDLEEWIHINPKAYFDSPIPLRNLLPAITVIDFDSGEEHFEFAFECELGYTVDHWANPAATDTTDSGSTKYVAANKNKLEWDSVTRGLCGSGTNAVDMVGKRIYFSDSFDVTTVTDFEGAGTEMIDFAHFTGLIVSPSFKDTDESVTGIQGAAALAMTDPSQVQVLKPIKFALDLGTSDTEVKPDGYRAEANTDENFDNVLFSLLMQNADLGGTLLLDPEADGGPALATNNSLNAMIAQGTFKYGAHIEELISGLSDIVDE